MRLYRREAKAALARRQHDELAEKCRTREARGHRQLQMIGSYGAQLLDWLNNYAFPTEMKFADADHAGRVADCFFDDLLRNGTTTAVAYCSVHRTSAEAFFERAARRNLCMIGGKVLMDEQASTETALHFVLYPPGVLV